MAHRLLVVTGGDDILQALPGQLGDDLDITMVESANEALWEMRDTPPQAILANLTLPDMSGLDLADILPNFDASTKIVLWSREEDPDARRDAETQGVHRYVSGTPLVADLNVILHEAIFQAQADQPAVEDTPKPEPAHSVPEPISQPEVPTRPVVERIERPSPTADPPAAETRPARRTIPNPDPPYKPPDRSSSNAASSETRPARRVSPNPDPPYQPPARSSSATSASSNEARPARRNSSNPDPPYQPPDRRTFTNRLASRTRAAQTTPTPAPTPVEPPPPPQPRRTGTLVVTKDNLAETQTILSDLWQNLSAQCVLLTDRAGMVLAQHGETNALPMMILLPLLSTSFSTAGEVARQLGEEDAMTLYMHDGARYNLYCFDIAQRFLLVVVFDKNIAATRIGSVWVEARSVIRRLTNALK